MIIQYFPFREVKEKLMPRRSIRPTVHTPQSGETMTQDFSVCRALSSLLMHMHGALLPEKRERRPNKQWLLLWRGLRPQRI